MRLERPSWRLGLVWGALLCEACGQAPASLPTYAQSWQRDVVYQIYPRSFADADGDGMGDLRGIIGKLDYLQTLGVNTVWLSPVYKTTNYDNGYDISDYLDIDPLFGTLADWQEMLQGLHQRHMKLIMDLVVNHSSDEHPWFVQEVRYKTLQRQLKAFAPPLGEDPQVFAQTMRQVITRAPLEPTPWPTGPYAGAAAAVLAFRSASERAEQAGYVSTQTLLDRLAIDLFGDASERAQVTDSSDFYIWRDAPSNWRSCFDGPAWHYQSDAAANYLALFSPHQPDLNWTNPRLRQAVGDMVKVWVDRGVDGLRMDVIDLIAKDMDFPDVPALPGATWGNAEPHFTNLPAAHSYVQELVHNSLNANMRTVGELAGIDAEDALQYTDPNRQELNEGILFTHMEADFDGEKYGPHTFSLKRLRDALTEQQRTTHGRGWLANYLENHDRPRAVSRFADDGLWREASAKMLGTLLFTLEGSPYIYQGEELGMTNAKFDHIDEVRDVEAIGFYNAAMAQGSDEPTAMHYVSTNTRDNSRTAMQWSNTVNAGFTTGQPWIKVNPNYTRINAEQALKDPNSVLAFYQRLIKMRARHDVWVYGAYHPLLENDPNVFAFTRDFGGDKVWVVLNFSAQPQQVDLPLTTAARLVLNNYDDGALDPATPLRPYEGRVYASF